MIETAYAQASRQILSVHLNACQKTDDLWGGLQLEVVCPTMHGFQMGHNLSLQHVGIRESIPCTSSKIEGFPGSLDSEELAAIPVELLE